MGSCVSSKNKKTIKSQKNIKISENDSLDDSQYIIKEFDGNIKSPFKKEDVDITLRVSFIVDQSKLHPSQLPNNIPKFQPYIQHPPKLESAQIPKPPPQPFKEIKPLAAPEIILEKFESQISGPMIGHHKDRGLKKFNLSVELTKVTEKFTSEVFANNVNIGNVVVYEKGIVFLPKELIKNYTGSYFCNYFGIKHCLDFIAILKNTCVFKLANCDQPGLGFSSVEKVSDKMVVKIGPGFKELNRINEKKLAYNCSENIDDSYVGTTVCKDEKPCFIIVSIINYREVNILPLDLASQYLERPISPPALNYQGLAVELYDNSHNKVSNALQYKNYFFSYKPASLNVKDKLQVEIDSKFVVLDFLSFGYFFILKSNQIYTQGLAKFDKNIVEKVGKFYISKGVINVVRSKSDSLIFKTNSKMIFTTDFIGTPIFGSNNEPFGIITRIMSAFTIKICRLVDLPSFLSNLDSSFHYYPYSKNQDDINIVNSRSYSRSLSRSSNFSSYSSSSSSSSSSSHSSPSSSSNSSSSSKLSFKNPDFIQAYRKNSVQELEGNFEENIKGEFSLDLDPLNIEIEPEEISYILVGSSLLKLSSKHYSPEIIKSPINYDEKSSYTTTSAGLLAVSGKNAHLIKDAELIELSPLSKVHHFHGSVVHDQKLFIISGVGTQVVEFLDLKNLNENWKEVMNLPQIREKPAACSSGDSIYVLGGEFNGSVTGTVFKFTSKWETLKWTVPQAMGMGAIFTNNTLVLFGGKGTTAYNDFYYTYSTNGEQLDSEEFPIPGLFHNKSVGRMNNLFSIAFSLTHSLEYENNFKLVSTALNS